MLEMRGMMSWRYLVVWIERSMIVSWIWVRRRVERRGCGKEARVDCWWSVGVRVLMWWKEGMRFSRSVWVRCVW